MGNFGFFALAVGYKSRPNSRYCIHTPELGRPVPAAFFSLLDHTILNPENTVPDALANPFGSPLDSLNFGLGRRGGVVRVGVAVTRFSGAFSFHHRLFPGPKSSCAARSRSDCCSR